MLDAALPDGSRLQATLGKEVTQNGSTFTIRRFKPDPFTPLDLVRFGTMSLQMLAWFWLIVENGKSLIFSGGTASGKTTGLNAICQFIPAGAKVVSIEDTREVNLPHENWIKAVTRSGSSVEGSGEIGMFELLKAALRQRPEYILVGEVRGVEATVAFQAMATGHTVYSTMHADSARSVVYRLENDPINIPRLVLQALDVITIQSQARVKGQRVRRVKEVVELVGMDPSTRELLTNTVFRWDAGTDTFDTLTRSYLLDQIAGDRNWPPGRMTQELARRTAVLGALIERGVTSVRELTDTVKAYARDPDAVAARLGVA
jgi:archaeal flagellar protein FlaI